MESRAMEGNEKGKSSLLEVISYYGVPYPNPPGFSSREEGSYKGAKSNLCEEGKGKEQKGKPSGKEEEDKGNNKGNDKGTFLFRPLANKDLFRPLADKGKDKGKGCKGGKPSDIAVRPLADNGKDKGNGCKGEEFSADRWDSIDDFPKHKQRRAAELVARYHAQCELMARYHALCDPSKDVTTSEYVERVGSSGLIQKLVEATRERKMLLQQLRGLWNQWEESAVRAEESEAGSGSSSSGWKMTGAEVWNC